MSGTALLTPDERKVLRLLVRVGEDFGCYPFKPIMRRTKLSRPKVRRACRSLARKGLAEFVRGLWHEDGGPAGAGYTATRQARAALAKATGA